MENQLEKIKEQYWQNDQHEKVEGWLEIMSGLVVDGQEMSKIAIPQDIDRLIEQAYLVGKRETATEIFTKLFGDAAPSAIEARLREVSDE